MTLHTEQAQERGYSSPGGLHTYLLISPDPHSIIGEKSLSYLLILAEKLKVARVYITRECCHSRETKLEDL